MGDASSGCGSAGRVSRRVVSRRGALAWVCWGITALLTSGCVLGLTARGAVAGQVPVILQYSCQLPVVGGTSLAATFVWPIGLQTATVGTSTPSLPVEVAGTVGSAARTVVSFAGIEWIEGTADVSAEIIAPQGDISETAKLTVPRTNVSTGSGPLAVPASGAFPSVLLSQAGQAKVVVGAVVVVGAGGSPMVGAAGTVAVAVNVVVLPPTSVTETEIP